MFFHPLHIRRQKNVKINTFTHAILLNGSHFATYHRITKQAGRNIFTTTTCFRTELFPSYLYSLFAALFQFKCPKGSNIHHTQLVRFPENSYVSLTTFSLSQLSADSKDLYNAFKYHCFDCTFQKGGGSNWGRGLLKIMLEATAETGVENGLPRSIHKAKKWKNLLTRCLSFLNKD